MQLHKDKDIAKLSMFLKVFSDPTRLRIIDALRSSAMFVGELSETLGMSQAVLQMNY